MRTTERTSQFQRNYKRESKGRHRLTRSSAACATPTSSWRSIPPPSRRLVDLVALCEMLTHDGLPDAAAAELVELIRASVD